MNITTLSEGSVSVVVLVGRLDTGTAPEAERHVFSLLDGGATKVVLDLAGLDYVSSAGLRVLLATAKRLKASGGALRVSGLNPTVREVFTISGFSTLLDVRADRAAALASLQG